jgi:hypothetical protein
VCWAHYSPGRRSTAAPLGPPGFGWRPAQTVTSS